MSYTSYKAVLSGSIIVLSFFAACYFTFHSTEVPPRINIEIDETDKWVKHYIGSNIERGNASTAIGDIDGNGKADVAICLGSRNTEKESDGIWWFQAPNWKFRRISSPDLPIRWSLALKTGDMDNDGDTDIVALSFNDSNVYLAINPLRQGGDVNKPWETIKILHSPGVHRDGERVELIDVDNDGYKDVIFPRGKPAEVRILFNPSGKLKRHWENKFVGIHGGGDAHDVLCADIDLDGDLDIISATGDKTWLGRVFWYENPNENTRIGRWTRHLISGTYLGNKLLEFISNYRQLNVKLSRFIGYANYGGLQIDDVDKDGRPDVLVTEAHGTPGKVIWLRNPIPPSDSWRKFVIGKQNFPHAALSFDVNGDGINEYWVPDASHEGKRTGGIAYYMLVRAENNEWSRHVVAPPPAVGRQSWAVDMDGDGDIDVVSTTEHSLTSNSVVWWENKVVKMSTESII